MDRRWYFDKAALHPPPRGQKRSAHCGEQTAKPCAVAGSTGFAPWATSMSSPRGPSVLAGLLSLLPTRPARMSTPLLLLLVLRRRDRLPFPCRFRGIGRGLCARRRPARGRFAFWMCSRTELQNGYAAGEAQCTSARSTVSGRADQGGESQANRQRGARSHRRGGGSKRADARRRSRCARAAAPPPAPNAASSIAAETAAISPLAASEPDPQIDCCVTLLRVRRTIP